MLSLVYLFVVMDSDCQEKKTSSVWLQGTGGSLEEYKGISVSQGWPCCRAPQGAGPRARKLSKTRAIRHPHAYALRLSVRPLDSALPAGSLSLHLGLTVQTQHPSTPVPHILRLAQPTPAQSQTLWEREYAVESGASPLPGIHAPLSGSSTSILLYRSTLVLPVAPTPALTLGAGLRWRSGQSKPCVLTAGAFCPSQATQKLVGLGGRRGCQLRAAGDTTGGGTTRE